LQILDFRLQIVLATAQHQAHAAIVCEPQRREEAKGEKFGFVPFVSFVANIPAASYNLPPKSAICNLQSAIPRACAILVLLMARQCDKTGVGKEFLNG
jgi:hypothetical protein